MDNKARRLNHRGNRIMVRLLIQSKDKHMYIRIVLNKEWYIILILYLIVIHIIKTLMYQV